MSATINFIKNDYKRGVDLSDEELKAYINKYFPNGVYCNEVMGVADCGNKPRPGAPSTEPIVDSAIYTRWKDAGGQCPNGGVKDPICSTGCRREKGSDITNGGTCY